MTDTSTRAKLLAQLWTDGFDLSRFPARRFRGDLQGWNSDHAYLTEAIERERPRIVVEIGVWKGASTIHMARKMRDMGLDAVVVAVDTWLGSWEHWETPAFFADLQFDHGYPTLYHTFLTNVVESEVGDFVIPLPLDSTNAALVLQHKGIEPDVVHIDGGHDYETVTSDLRRWWPLLRPGGLLVMDDYDASGAIWPSVRDAVEAFRKTVKHVRFEAAPYKARFRKPIV